MKENKLTRRIVFQSLGLALSILPPALAIVFYFPVWAEMGGEYMLSGFTALLLLIAFVPLIRVVKRALRSPAGYMIWLAIFLLFLISSKIADEMIVISFVGLLGNIAGAVLFRLARRSRDE